MILLGGGVSMKKFNIQSNNQQSLTSNWTTNQPNTQTYGHYGD